MPAGGLISVSYNEYFPLPGVTLSGISWAPGNRGLTDTVAPKTGALDVNLPTSPNPYPAAAAGSVASYFDDYYNRIHFTPGNKDFGAITAQTSIDIDVWNAYVRDDVVLTGIGVDSIAGLGVAPAAPQTFAPLQNRSFTLTAELTGSPIIDTAINWTFDNGYLYAFPVSGNRAKEWPLEPNWSQSYKLTYAFTTEILQSRSGKEQRIALRTSPRKAVSYRSMATGPAFDSAKALLWHWQDKVFVLPELPRFVTSVSEMAAGSDTIQVDSLPSWLLPGATVMLRYGTASELRVVDTAVAGAVTFRATSAVTWPEGTKLYAAISGYLGNSVGASRVTNALAQVVTNLAVMPLSEQWVEPPAAAQTFNGRELFLKRPNWASEVNVTAQHEVDEIDYDRGGIFRYTAIPFGTESRRALYLNRDAIEAQQLLDFFCRMHGRQGEFYMPTWEYDFKPKVPSISTAASLRVAGPELADSYGDSTVHKALFVMLLDGSLLYRKVLSVSRVTDAEGTDSLVTISGTWGATVSQDTIVMCGWMPAWRLASDELVVEWLTNSVAQVQMTMQTVEDLAV